MNYTRHYVKLVEEHEITKDVMSSPPLLITQPALKVKVGNEARILGKIVLPYTEVEPGIRWVTHFEPPPRFRTDYPAIVISKFGQGRVVYFSNRIENEYIERGYPYLRNLPANAVRWAGGTQPITVQAPISVEVTAFEQRTRNRIIIHLVNFQTKCGRSVVTSEGKRGRFFGFSRFLGACLGGMGALVTGYLLEHTSSLKASLYVFC